MSYRAALVSLIAVTGFVGSAFAAPTADYAVKFNSQFDAAAHPEWQFNNVEVTANGLKTYGYYDDNYANWTGPSTLKLDASNVLSSAGDYTINLDFGGVAVTQWAVKLLDFANRSQDAGLYIDGHNISFYDTQGGWNFGTNPLIQDNTAFNVTLSRSSATSLVVGYINGIEQFSFLDNLGVAVFDPLNFYVFTDDFATPGSGGDAYESRPGVLKGISIYKSALSSGDIATLHGVGVVPEPETLALVLGGLLTCAFVGKRRRA